MSGVSGAHPELELKAVVPDATLLRRHLVESGAEATFRGLMEDRIFDREETLKERDEVLRIRTWRPDAAPARAQMAWKGPTRRSPEGYKLRDELEFTIEGAVKQAQVDRAVQLSRDKYCSVWNSLREDTTLDVVTRIHANTVR